MSQGSITTFYSYKGGTGRTMALVNTACLLAREAEKNILLIDWDLEAPGLHHYLHDYLPAGYDEREGLIELFRKTSSAPPEAADIQAYLAALFSEDSPYLLPVMLPNLPPTSRVWLLKAGKNDRAYSGKVTSFSWQDFHRNLPTFFETFIALLQEKFHHTLIDSRTGHTDIGAICTMTMPEKLVLVFTPNRQSLEGVLRLAKRALEKRTETDSRPLKVYPLPCRMDLGEDALRKQWHNEYTAEFENVFRSIYKLRENETLSDYFDRAQIRHFSHLAYGETIAVLQESPSNISSAAYAYEQFRQQVFGQPEIWKTAAPRKRDANQIFVSYAREDAEEKSELIKHLIPWARRTSSVIWSDDKIGAGREWSPEIEQQIAQSTAFLLLLSPDFMASDFIQTKEWPAILEKKNRGEAIVIIPVLFKQCDWKPDFGGFNLPNEVPLNEILSKKKDGARASIADKIIERIESNVP
jgi:MinD-like ATPase involved in chromosome partitioning or flagellar assembly